MPELKGALGYVLGMITERVNAGEPAISYVDISLDTGYSVPTVQAAVEKLARESFICVQKQRSGRPHIYRLVSPDARRARAVARLVNLIQ